MKVFSLLAGVLYLGLSVSALADDTVYTVNVANHYAADGVSVFGLRTALPFWSTVKGNIKIDTAPGATIFSAPRTEVGVAGTGSITLDSTQGATIYFDVNRSRAGGACRISAQLNDGAISKVKEDAGVFTLVNACKNFKVTTQGATLNIDYVKI